MFKTLFKDKTKILEELDAKIAKKEAVLTSICNSIIAKETDVAKLETGIAELTKKLNETKYEQVRDFKASVDWDAMQAFSIERVISTTHEVPVTCIGYRAENKIKEWILFVNKEIHDALVEEFKQYVSKKAEL
jgi:uncharacterized coiled-coil protein SlyX